MRFDIMKNGQDMFYKEAMKPGKESSAGAVSFRAVTIGKAGLSGFKRGERRREVGKGGNAGWKKGGFFPPLPASSQHFPGFPTFSHIDFYYRR